MGSRISALMGILLFVTLILTACSSTTRKERTDVPAEDAVPDRVDQRRTEQSVRNFRPELCRAYRLIGAPVRNSSGEDLGNVEDLVIDSGRKSVSCVILAAGGVMGVWEVLHAFSWQEVTVLPDSAGDEGALMVVIETTREQLLNTEGFMEDEWLGTSDLCPPRIKYKHTPSDPVGEGDPPSGPDDDAGRDDLRRMVLLRDKPVDSSDGKTIGEVQDILIDINAGDIAYIVMDVESGMVDLDPRVAVIPWSALGGPEDLRWGKPANTLDELIFEDADIGRFEGIDEAIRCHEIAGGVPYWTR